MRRVPTAILILSLGLTSVARAEDPRGAEAVRLFEESAEAYREGRFREAVVLLERAYELNPDPVLLYNVGRAYEGLGEYRAALKAYERYMHDEQDVPDRPAMERRVATLRAAIAERERLEAEAASREDGRSRLPPWILVGVGGAGLGAATVFAVLARSKEADAAAEPIQELASEKGQQSQTLATIANVGFIAGAVLVAGGLTWAILGSRTPPKQSLVRVVPYGAGLAVGARF